MKKFKMMMVAVVFALACGSASAADFDWSKCWCTFGGGIEQGDVLLSVDAGLGYTVFGVNADGYWWLPYVEVSADVATKIGKLPFTFGGYAGFDANGYNSNNYAYSYWNAYTGAEALYHISLPPSGLDLYAGARAGVHFTFGSANTVGFDWGVVAIGANYFFSDTFGVNLEIGYPRVKAGVTFKF